MIDEKDRVRVRTGVVAATLLAWTLLGTYAMRMPAMTAAGMQHPMMAEQATIGAGFNEILHGMPSWLLMVVAMMAPILAGPLELVRANGLARRRTRSTLLFLSCYTAVWIAAGGLLLYASALADNFRFGRAFTAFLILIVALIWQGSPIKQLCLNRCHTFRAMPAFGSAADAATLRYGIRHGMWCAASCWPWMLLPMVSPGNQLRIMALVSLIVFCERLEEPAPVQWRYRGTGRATRIVASWVKNDFRTFCTHVAAKTV
jgi:predicted metal-binding membrane protein